MDVRSEKGRWTRGRLDRGSARHAFLAAALGMILAAVPLLQDRAAFFRDDMEAQFIPTLVAVGRTIWATGTVPLLTTQTWWGGNLAGELQYGLFNPVLLALYAALPALHTQDLSAAFLSISLTGMLAAGSFLLARSLTLSVGLAHVAAVAVAGNNFLHHWFAVSWLPALASTAFMVWAMAFLLRAHERRSAFVAAGLAVCLTASAGWPHAMIVLGLFTAAWMTSLVVSGQRQAAAYPALAAALGVAAAAVAILPFMSVMEQAARATFLMNTGLLVANLRDVLSVSNPVHFGTLINFPGRPNTILAPVFHVAWFVLPLAALLDWKRVPWVEPRILAVLVFGCLMLLGTQGPSDALWLRFPIKFLPYFQIAAVLFILLALQVAGFAEPSRHRTAILVLVMAVSVLSSFQSLPGLAALHLAFGLVILVASLRLQRHAPQHPALAAVALACTTWALAATTRAVLSSPALPSLGVFAPYNAPREIALTEPLTRLPTRFEFHATGGIPPSGPAERFGDILFGQMGLAQGRALVNGYSPIGHRGLAEQLCWTGARWTCPEAVLHMLRLDDATGASLAELMRVDIIFVDRATNLVPLGDSVPAPWRFARETPFAVVLERDLPAAHLPGSLSWPRIGLQARAIGEPGATLEALRIERRDPEVRRIVFARTYWPGYRATFDGADLPVRAHAGFLVAVDLPPAPASGELVLRFAPRGLEAGAAISAVAIGTLFLLAVLLHAPAKRRRLSPSARPSP
jgi:hypothetical protein